MVKKWGRWQMVLFKIRRITQARLTICQKLAALEIIRV